MRRAVEGGIIFFDTADVYNGGQSEVVTGRLLSQLFGMREEYVVATKVHGQTMPGENGARPVAQAHPRVDRRVARAARARLRRPVPDPPLGSADADRGDDGGAPRRRARGQGALHRREQHVRLAVREGAVGRGRRAFVSMQNHYNLVYREEEREMIPQCIDQGVGVIPWSPLARGLLAGNRTREGERLTTRAKTDPFADSLYTPDLDFAVIDRVGEVAAERGVAPAQVALAWLLHKPGVTAPIVGATKLEHLEDALAAEQLS